MELRIQEGSLGSITLEGIVEGEVVARAEGVGAFDETTETLSSLSIDEFSTFPSKAGHGRALLEALRREHPGIHVHAVDVGPDEPDSSRWFWLRMFDEGLVHSGEGGEEDDYETLFAIEDPEPLVPVGP